MGFFQLRSPPGTAWPPVPPAEVAQVWSAYQELERTQWLAPAELAALQLQQLRSLLLHCFHHVPYYRRLLSQAGISCRPLASLEQFRRLPLLTRELYQAHFEHLRAQSLPAGMVEAGGSYTSGTNGVPIRVLKTNRDGLWWSAFYLRDLEWSGLDPRGRLATIRLIAMSRDELGKALQGVTSPHWAPFFGLLLECGPLFGMDIRQDPRTQLAWLRKVRPDYLLSLPSNLDHLAGLLQESGESLPGLKAVQSFGEPLLEATRSRLESAFGVPVKNLYSATETGYIASPCPLGHGLHVHAENVLAEVLDANDQPVGPGETGRLVVTSLNNFITPMLRYDILDDVTLAAGPCPCGRGLPLWTRVEGRRVPLYHLPDGGRRSMLSTILALRKVGGCRQFQIIQRAPAHVVVRVVPDRTWCADHADNLRQAVRQEIGFPIQVDVEEFTRLEQPAGGKLRIAIVEMDEVTCKAA